MSRQPLASNPESAFYYRHIRRQRRIKRVQGYLYLLEAVGCFTVVCTAGILALSRNLMVIVPMLCFFLLGVFLLITGILAIKRGFEPISSEEVAEQRRTERKQLFQYAQGVLPWRFSFPTALLEVLTGCFFMVIGVFALVVTVAQPASYGAFMYVLFLPAGMYFLFDAFKRVKIAKHLARWSGQELAKRLALGELTKGQ